MRVLPIYTLHFCIPSLKEDTQDSYRNIKVRLTQNKCDYTITGFSEAYCVSCSYSALINRKEGS